MKKLIRNITSVPQFIGNSIIAVGKSLYTPFLPTYDVVFIMYNLVPGKPLDKMETIYPFPKGEAQKAADFYTKILHSTATYKMMPSEVVLKRKNKVVKTTQFGPVKEIQELVN